MAYPALHACHRAGASCLRVARSAAFVTAIAILAGLRLAEGVELGTLGC